jgi:hypothetical protein
MSYLQSKSTDSIASSKSTVVDSKSLSFLLQAPLELTNKPSSPTPSFISTKASFSEDAISSVVNPITGKANKKKSFAPTDNIDVVYEGSKSFWKHNQKLDILIALHRIHGIYEIVAYDPDEGIESKRIYVSKHLLIQKLDSDEIYGRIKALKEANIRQKKSATDFEYDTVLEKLHDKACVQYLVTRIATRKNLTENDFIVGLNVLTGDKTNSKTSKLDVILEDEDIPTDLTPLVTSFLRNRT